MVRRQKKDAQGIETLEALEKEAESEVKNIKDIRNEAFRKEELNTDFYFAVVFDTKAERNQFLQERNLSLEENVFIRAKDFKV